MRAKAKRQGSQSIPVIGPRVPRSIEDEHRRGKLTVITTTRGSEQRVVTVQRGRRTFRRIEFRTEVWWEFWS